MNLEDDTQENGEKHAPSPEAVDAESDPGTSATAAATDNAPVTAAGPTDGLTGQPSEAKEELETAEEVTPGGMQQELEELRVQAAEARDALLRARAEIENLHKRQRRELENASRYALDSFLRELLPVIDSLEMGLHSASEDAEDVDTTSLCEGLQLTLKLLRDRMQKAGVEVIDPADAPPFDPESHEAVSSTGDTQGDLRVVSVLQKGYRLHGRLLRPARVVTGRE